MPKIPMPKPGFKTVWKEITGSGGTYKPRPMNVELGNDESPSSNYGADADKTFDKGRGTGTTGKQPTNLREARQAVFDQEYKD